MENYSFKKFVLSNKKISLSDFSKIVKEPDLKVEIDDEVKNKILASRKLLDEYVENGRIIYGVTTSMGGFVDYLVPVEFAEKLQNNLISSVASNVGEYMSDEDVRATMLARLISLSKGASAISLENFKIFLDMFNKNIIPCIPKKGSLGASGDLGPLAFIALVGVGKWKAKFEGEVLTGEEALIKAKIKKMKLSYKEGLALINGTSAMAGTGAMVSDGVKQLLGFYEYISALTFEGLATKLKPFDPIVHKRKLHKGQNYFSTKIYNILKSSKLVIDEAETEANIQEKKKNVVEHLDNQIEDAYSLRCSPQILGPLYETVEFASTIIENEINSSSDNPLILSEENNVFHNGHFHGQYISMAMDYLSICLTTLSNLSDRRIDRFMDKSNSNGLPAFLTKENPGLRLGLMGGQFMSTSLTAENRSLCTPLSIQTLTSTGDFQDIVSFGLIASRRCKEILENTLYIVSFELLCACQAIDIREGSNLSNATKVLYDNVRKIVPYLSYDTSITPFIEELKYLVQNTTLLKELDNITSIDINK
ncbi:phenylalanine aminomutase (D-beta-phenylalanine forming) [Bacillus tequilensis]|uniref:phenylalanine aminomutase (D-beta-phenylalanine forming) n=1 Tax=Bacillus tequilensis TaxID=227866 RepID=UPI001576BDC3|nr:phenylalanine aminomutase (D-beta-phenylalanine forming) [Bacillus tequilensis]NTU24950.1 phenylalanine aminomutase (D-beta-phenylalanine forming) [Bacillus tequilensis]